MSASALCSFPHPMSAVAPWLCVTHRDDPTVHHHVCGNHAHQFRRSSSPLIFRTIRPYSEDEHPPRYAWLDGFGCVFDALSPEEQAAMEASDAKENG